MNHTSKWKIPDTSFYPFGLVSNSNENKTGFVAWSSNILITYLFKRFENKNSLTDTFHISLQETIKDIIATEINTICLTTKGNAFYFSSYQNLKKLNFISNAKCICPSKSGYALITVNDKKNIYIDIYKDFKSFSEAELDKKSYDISFNEENIFNSSWTSQKFTIVCIEVTIANRNFLDQLLKKPIMTTDIYLFTIGNNLFSFNRNSTNTDEYEILLVLTVASQIEYIQYISSFNILLLYMSCGSAVLIFISNKTQALDQSIHLVSSDIEAIHFSNEFIYYSDGFSVGKIEICWENNMENYYFQKTEKSVPGITALTWVESIKKLVCLSENNIFYKIKFSSKEKDLSKDRYELLDGHNIKQLQYNFKKLANIIEIIDKLNEDIDFESTKQQLLGSYTKKHLYVFNFQAECSFYTSFPVLNDPVIYPDYNVGQNKNSNFMTISIQIKFHKLLEKGQWNIVLYTYSSEFKTRCIKLDKSLLNDRFYILTPINIESIFTIPKIIIEIGVQLNIESEFLYISLPVQVKPLELSQIFSSLQNDMIMKQKPFFNKFSDTIQSITEKFFPDIDEICSKNNLYKSKFKIPLLMCFDDLCDIFKVRNNEKLENQNEIKIFIIHKEIKIIYTEVENIIEISTNDPGLLFYTKLYLMEQLSTNYYNDESINTAGYLQQLMPLKSEAEMRYMKCKQIKEYEMKLKSIHKELRQLVQYV